LDLAGLTAVFRLKDARKFVITLEFGKEIINIQPDPFALVRPHKDDPNRADKSPGLHPIVYEYQGSQLFSKHHVIEDIFGEWKEDVHLNPLRDYFTKKLAEFYRTKLGAPALEQAL